MQVGSLPLQTMLTALDADSCDFGGRYQLHEALTQSIHTRLIARAGLLRDMRHDRACGCARARLSSASLEFDVCLLSAVVHAHLLQVLLDGAHDELVGQSAAML